MSMLSHIDEIVGRSQANCLAQLNLTTLRGSYKLNSVVSKVIVLATIFVPCHLVTGLFEISLRCLGRMRRGCCGALGLWGLLLRSSSFAWGLQLSSDFCESSVEDLSTVLY